MNFSVVLLAVMMIHAMDAIQDRLFGFKNSVKRETICKNKNKYKQRPQCVPHNCIGDKTVSCEKLGKSVPVGGDLYSDWGLHYNLMFSPYYGARIADALGYDECCPAKNRTFLEDMNLVSPWSGTHGPISIEGLFGFDRHIISRCVFPTDKYPYLCTGSVGTPGTQAEDLGTLSYISLLHDEKKHRWTLFGHCWNPKTPEDPNAIPTATSFNVYSLDSSLSTADREAIITKLKQIGFSTDDIIEPDFTGKPKPVKC